MPLSNIFLYLKLQAFVLSQGTFNPQPFGGQRHCEHLPVPRADGAFIIFALHDAKRKLLPYDPQALFDRTRL